MYKKWTPAVIPATAAFQRIAIRLYIDIAGAVADVLAGERSINSRPAGGSERKIETKLALEKK